MEQPTRIELEPEGRLVLTWASGGVTGLSSIELRRACPCAVCREGEVVVTSAHIRTIEQAGAYGLRIVFDDHDTGIFSYEYLRSLGTPH
jgi:DUF971 family protein